MIDRLIDLSVKHRPTVFVVVAGACLLGWWSMRRMPLDAIPDLGETQVIVFSRWDRSPDVVEDQVTYPIVTAMLGAPKVKTVRGISDFGYSYVYVIFEDGTDLYWARSRTLEYLSTVLPRLPPGARTEMGPDASGLGWIYQYALIDKSGRHSLADLRAVQDWYLRYHLRSVPGVAEVAPIGGFGQQYQVDVDPNRLRAYGIPIGRVVDAVRAGNVEASGRLIELGGTEYMVRGRGYARSIADFEEIVVSTSESGTPIRVKDLGQVALGPELRRGVADLNGRGETVSGIVVMRQDQNALQVIDRVKAKLEEIKPGLPEGVEIVPVYDRSELIRRAIDNTRSTLIEVIVTVALVILLFLWHPVSAAIPILTIPAAVLISFIPFRMLGLTANIMSLGGLVIAVGALVDAGIVVVEQTHKRLEEWERGGRKGDHRPIMIEAVKQVAGPSFFALLVIAVSFLPVLTLEAEEGRLFKPLAYTKNLAILVAAVIAVTLDPALRLSFAGKLQSAGRRGLWGRVARAFGAGVIHPEEHHPVSRVLMRIYQPAVTFCLKRKGLVIGGAVALIALTIPAYLRLGSEFMPPLDEGSILYMPSTMPGISASEAQRLLQTTDRILSRFPEVDRVLGKAGRAGTSTDPAPLSMLETVVVLRPRSEWPRRISQEELIARMDEALRIPGVANAWTMPVKGRIDMLSTGLRTPVGLKISGADLRTLDALGARIEEALRDVPGTRSVFAERTGGGYFLDVAWNRRALGRYGLSVEDAQRVIESAVGGEDVTTAVDGRARYPVSVRYLPDFRSDFESLRRVLVPAGAERQIPLAQLADLRAEGGPSMIRDENGLLTSYVYVHVAGRDPDGYVDEARKTLASRVTVPPGYHVAWSGQYEASERVKERLLVVVPLTVLLIFVLLYLNTRSIAKTLIVLLAVPFSAVGAIWFLYLLGYNLSVGVWVGLIALLGVDAETGVFMLLYLDLAYEKAKREGRMKSAADLQAAIQHGAVRRLRPKFMTVATTFLGLVPILWATGTGSDVMKRIAAPMIGGIFTSFLLELLVYPPIFEAWKWRSEVRRLAAEPVRA